MVVGVGLSAIGVEAIAGIAGVMGGTSLLWLRKSWTRRRLARLPFPVRSTRTLANENKVVEVVITFALPIAPVLLEDVLGDARTQLPARAIVADSAHSISIAQWRPSEPTDGQLQDLADLLEGWGRQLHAVASITEVLVVLARF